MEHAKNVHTKQIRHYDVMIGLCIIAAERQTQEYLMSHGEVRVVRTELWMEAVGLVKII